MAERASWLWGEISREKAEELILGGDRKDGTFLVRARPKHDGQYLLTLVFRGRATHHLLVKSPDSQCWTINKKQFGSCETLAAVVSMLQEPVVGWPVKLSTEVSNPEPGGDLNSASIEDATVVSPSSEESKTSSDAGEATGQEQPYFHGQISRDESEEIVKRYALANHGGKIDGLWLVRQRAGKVVDMSELVILVGYQGRCTHHLCQTQPDGFIKVNGKDANQSRSLAEVLTFLKTKPRFWPVDMNEFVPASWTTDTPSTELIRSEAPETKNEDVDEITTGAAAPIPVAETSSTVAASSITIPSGDATSSPAQSSQDSRPPCLFTSGPSSYDIPKSVDISQLLEATPKLSFVMKRPNSFVEMGFTANFESNDKPPTVVQVEKQGIADSSGLQVGDVIVQVDSKASIGSRGQSLFEPDALELALLVARPPFTGAKQAYDEEEDNFPEDGYYTDE